MDTWRSWQFQVCWFKVGARSSRKMARCHLAGVASRYLACRLMSASLISTAQNPGAEEPRMPRCRSRFMGGGGGPPRCGMASSTLPLPPSPSPVLEAFLKGTASALHIPHLVHVIIRCTSTNTTTRGETYLQKPTRCLQTVPWHATSCLDRVSPPWLLPPESSSSPSRLSRPIPTLVPSSCPLAGLLSLVPRFVSAPPEQVSRCGNFVARATDRLLLSCARTSASS